MLVVAYHAIDGPASRVVVSAQQFEDDLSSLIDTGYSLVSLDRCADWLESRVDLPPLTAVVTFDDGYASIATRALSVLQRLQAPATVFVVGGRLGLDNQWPGQPAWVPTMPLLDAHMLRDLVASGVTIGSHSWSHPRLRALDGQSSQDEIVAAADRLEQLAGVPVRHFAYPYGSFGRREIVSARSRFRTAVTSACRPVDRHSDPHVLGRLDAHDAHIASRLNLLGSAALMPYLAVRRGLRALLR